MATMSDLHTIANAADLRLALQSGHLERTSIQSLDLLPLHVPAVTMAHVNMLGPRLTGLQIDDLQAKQVQARGVLLRAVRWPNAQLSRWHVSASQAQEMQLSGARLEDCQFVDTPVTNSNFRRTQWLGCTFAQSDLNHVVLAESFILNCRFEDSRQGGAVLDNADLRDAVLCHVDLRGANLLRGNFTGAILVDVDLRDANLREVRFDGALLVNCRLDRTEFADLGQKQASQPEVLERLRHLPPEQVLAVAAALLTRPQTASAQTPGVTESPTGAPSTSGDAVANLLKLPFPALLRELQGRGGPAELARLRVDGDHVWATTHTGDEVRLTSGAQVQRQAPQMAVPLPIPPPQAAAPTPVIAQPKPRTSGLEID
jgi:uncharacterized protein YjbI with pentapeptide repeats